MTIKKISPEALYNKLQNQEKVTVLDVRSEDKYNDFHIEDKSIENLNINKTEILEGDNNSSFDAVPKETKIIVTCTTGNSAARCASVLAEKDYDVMVLEGGITAWKEYMKSIG